MSIFWERTIDQLYVDLLREIKRIRRIEKKIMKIEKNIGIAERRLYEYKIKSQGADLEMVGI